MRLAAGWFECNREACGRVVALARARGTLPPGWTVPDPQRPDRHLCDDCSLRGGTADA